MPAPTAQPLICAPENAHRFALWLQTRGGLAIWPSVNLSNPGASWACPVNTADGLLAGRPTWEADGKPERIITDPAEVVVQPVALAAQVPVALKQRGMRIVLTDASTKRVRKAVEKAGPGSYYELADRIAVVFRPEGAPVPLMEWVAANPEASK